jgi:hypothetical protein
VPTPAPLPLAVPMDTGPLPNASSPSVSGACSALRFRSVWHSTLDFHQTPPRGHTFHLHLTVPLSLRFGFPPSGSQRTLTSCSMPMPGARSAVDGRSHSTAFGSLNAPSGSGYSERRRSLAYARRLRPKSFLTPPLRYGSLATARPLGVHAIPKRCTATPIAKGTLVHFATTLTTTSRRGSPTTGPRVVSPLTAQSASALRTEAQPPALAAQLA